MSSWTRNQNPKLKENICIIEIWPIKRIIILIRIRLSHFSFHECKVFIFNKINESLDWFRMEMSSWIRIKTRKLKENICIIERWPIKWIIPLIRIRLSTNSFHECKVFNFITINESLDCFRMEMSSWIRNQNPEIEIKHLHHRDFTN